MWLPLLCPLGGRGAPLQLLTHSQSSPFTPLFPPTRALHAGQAAYWAGLTLRCHISLPFPPRDPQQSLGFGQLPHKGSTETFQAQPSAAARRPAFSSMRQAWAPPASAGNRSQGQMEWSGLNPSHQFWVDLTRSHHDEAGDLTACWNNLPPILSSFSDF